MNKLVALAIVVGFAFLQSCGDDDTCTTIVAAEKLAAVNQEKLTSDLAIIDAYLSANGIVAEIEPNKMRYVITELGTGVTPCLESRVTVKYKGNLLSDPSLPPFDQTTTGYTFSLSNLILGWQLVLPLVPEGSKLTLYVPSGYGYGASVAAGGKIPANANLIFEMELAAVR
jgi:FKBP-type peptidyl-prolyl cis-trans isomerase FkpA